MGHSEQSPGSRQKVRGKGSRILGGGTLDYQAVDWRGVMEGMYFSRSDRIQEVHGGVSESHEH